MIKQIIKLAAAALIANACWQLGSAYSTFLRFKDAIEETTQFGSGRTERELQQRIVELASQYDVPLDADAISVRRVDEHTLVEGEYTQAISLAPGYTRPWTFKLKTDTFVRVPAKLEGLPVQ